MNDLTDLFQICHILCSLIKSAQTHVYKSRGGESGSRKHHKSELTGIVEVRINHHLSPALLCPLSHRKHRLSFCSVFIQVHEEKQLDLNVFVSLTHLKFMDGQRIEELMCQENTKTCFK